ncbi:RluA family pseudouridine synthase [Novosphingobium bradum]|uniref:RluA family pseudouridine synthase n=1 Tax=Novosphingobium bradum TaxID=1737444 RepID=A0ABV7IM17_9SPHN
MSEISILFEDGEALVIDKPAGLPLDRPRAGGMALEDRLDELKLGFQRPPAPVHRLDRDTSGCLLLARNPKALKRFAAAFEAREVDKRYLGIVAGPVEGPNGESEGTIALSLAKISSAADGWRMIAAKKGKPAVTHWRKLAEHGGRTLVEFRPETGRTHQIRVHAAHAFGHALLGDGRYGTREGATRTMLHAADIVVTRAGKPPIRAHAPTPADFAALGFVDPEDGAAPDVGAEGAGGTPEA